MMGRFAISATAPRFSTRAPQKLDEAEAEALLLARRGRPQAKAAPAAGAFAVSVMRPLRRDAPAELSLSELKRRWPEIVGERLASMTAPEKLTRAGASHTLTIRAAGSAAPFVQHQERLIIERCALAGARIEKILIRQGAPAAMVEGAAGRFPRALTPDEEAGLRAGLDRVEDPRLKTALARLGRAVCAHSRPG